MGPESFALGAAVALLVVAAGIFWSGYAARGAAVTLERERRLWTQGQLADATAKHEAREAKLERALAKVNTSELLS